ncbi:MAG: hypothetical protein ACI4I9_05160 [Porcipelethomonas sp.]
MKYSINPDHGYTVSLGDLKIHLVSYEVFRTKKYKFESVAQGQAALGEDGTYPASLVIKGRILKSDNINAEEQLYNAMSNDERYFLNLDRIFFNAARLESFRTFTDMKSQFIECEIKFMCDSYLEANIS